MPISLDRMGVYYFSSKDSKNQVINTWKKATEDLETFTHYGRKDSTKSFQICLSSYYNVWESNNTPIYFSLPMIGWGKNVILDFNKRFKNIQIEILDETYIYYKHGVEETPYGKRKVEKLSFEEGGDKIYLPLFTVNFSQDYTELSKYLIPMMVAIYLRLFAINDYYTHFKDKEPEDYLEFACQHNDKFCGEYEVHVLHAPGEKLKKLLPEHILYLDDLELMNNAFEKRTYGYYHGNCAIDLNTHVYQTSVINKLYDFKNGKVQQENNDEDEEEENFEDEEDNDEENNDEEEEIFNPIKRCEIPIEFDEEEFIRKVKELDLL